MYVDSHCHLNSRKLQARFPEILAKMVSNQVTHALCACCSLEQFAEILALTQEHAHLYGSAGVHPDYQDTPEPTVEILCEMARHPGIVAIGETGLDYSRLQGDLDWQRERFRVHIRAARACGKPLIIHTRAASADTLRIMHEEGAGTVHGGPGGVLHCFTESLEMAEAAMAMGFYISFSGIVTFKSARELQAVALAVPLERMLIETDSPYLSPEPLRGRINEPGNVVHVAAYLAALTGIPLAQLAARTTDNFFNLFNIVRD